MIHIRTITFCFLIVVGLFLPFWAYALCMLLYVFLWNGSELLILSACIDAQFGGSFGVMSYQYFIITAGALLISVFMKPYMTLYR